MSLIFKPNGALDLSTDPSDLEAQAVGNNTISFAMQRCKNLRLDNLGVAKLRHGSSKINAEIMSGTPDLIFEVDGNRYVFNSDGTIYRNEQAISGAVCNAPVLLPAGGEYSDEQTVEMSTSTAGATIYYTLDGSTPSIQSSQYSGPIIIQLFTQVKAIAIRSGFIDSEITVEYYSAQDSNIITETDQNAIITETDSNNVINEGLS